jgi:molybdate transport system substrate-binding protein
MPNSGKPEFGWGERKRDRRTVTTQPPYPAIHLFAAGSLKEALGDVAKAYEAVSGNAVEATFGPSGLLKDEIMGGAPAHVFASANMVHPQTLHDAGKSGAVTGFTRNTLCALVSPTLGATTGDLLACMLDPKVKLGTSTTKADPSGDYAFAAFAKAEALKPGARDVLERKAIKLTGARDSAAPPAGTNVYGWHVAQDRADIFLTYRTNALAAQRQYPAQKCVMLPAALAVGAAYGLTVMKDAPAGALAFAQYILADPGQTILARHGFDPPTP